MGYFLILKVMSIEQVLKSWKDHLWKVNVVTLHTINSKEPWNPSFFLLVEQRPNLFKFGSSFTQILNTEIIYSIILFSVRKVWILRIYFLLPLYEITKVFLISKWTFLFEKDFVVCCKDEFRDLLWSFFTKEPFYRQLARAWKFHDLQVDSLWIA